MSTILLLFRYVLGTHWNLNLDTVFDQTVNTKSQHIPLVKEYCLLRARKKTKVN